MTEIEVERDFRLRSGRINLPVPEKGKTYRRDKLIGEETEAQREMVIPISMQRVRGNSGQEPGHLSPRPPSFRLHPGLIPH